MYSWNSELEKTYFIISPEFDTSVTAVTLEIKSFIEIKIHTPRSASW